MFESISIAGVKVDAINGEAILTKLEEIINQNRKGFFAYINAHAVNLAQKYKWFKHNLNKSIISYADGQGIRLATWLLGLSVPPLVNLTHWGQELLSFCNQKSYSIFFLGSSENVIQRAVKNLQKTYPSIRIVGYHHGYFQKQGKENDEIIQLINKSKPNVLFVGMGMPLQEKWISENFAKLQVNGIFNAGSYIDILAGVKRICPKWISNIGFEWLFRLFQDPIHLSVRYIVGNPKFIYYIFSKKDSN